MNEYAGPDKRKSNMLLIIALLIAAIVVVWVILAFDAQAGKQDGIGQSKINQILVAQITPLTRHI